MPQYVRKQAPWPVLRGRMWRCQPRSSRYHVELEIGIKLAPTAYPLIDAACAAYAAGQPKRSIISLTKPDGDEITIKVCDAVTLSLRRRKSYRAATLKIKKSWSAKLAKRHKLERAAKANASKKKGPVQPPAL